MTRFPAGKVVAPATKGDRRQAAFILAPKGAIPRQRHGQPTKRKALLWAGYGPTSADLEVLCRTSTVLYNSLGRQALNQSERRSRSRTEPLAPRAEGPAAPSTLAAKPRQPSGIPPSADSPSKAHGIKYRTQQKAPVFRLVLFYYSCPCRASWPPWPCTP